MSRIVVLAQAELDLDEWQDYFESQQKGLSTKFIRAFQQGTERIAQFPRRYAVYSGNVRVCPLRPFSNIGIFYRVEYEASYLLRVLDLRRNPRRLRRELEI